MRKIHLTYRFSIPLRFFSFKQKSSHNKDSHMLLRSDPWVKTTKTKTTKPAVDMSVSNQLKGRSWINLLDTNLHNFVQSTCDNDFSKALKHGVGLRKSERLFCTAAGFLREKPKNEITRRSAKMWERKMGPGNDKNQITEKGLEPSG